MGKLFSFCLLPASASFSHTILTIKTEEKKMLMSGENVLNAPTIRYIPSSAATTTTTTAKTATEPERVESFLVGNSAARKGENCD